ncbi:MAG: type II toxin-antitoxin system PemK/MazF family toxin [Marmoricola sp.]
MIVRGGLYEIRPAREARGHEQQGKRLAVIIQSDRFASSTVTVAMTSTSAGAAIYRPVVEIKGQTTRVLTDQIYTVDLGRLGPFIGVLDSTELLNLDRALLLKLGLI